MKKIKSFWFCLLCLLVIESACSKSSSGTTSVPPVMPPVIPPVIPPDRPGPAVDYWITKGDQSALLEQQAALRFGAPDNSFAFIDIDSTQTFQTIDGFGYTLTGGSATLINNMNAGDKASLLNELFGNGPTSIDVSYLRISIGASDLNASVFSYDDKPTGQTDINLTNFDLGPDKTDLVPILKAILQINPSIKILATPWSAPVWMKDNGSSVGGSLLPQYYDVYAHYFVKYIQQMKANGITIDAITPQNEPLNPENNPSLSMTAAEETDFIRNNLAFFIGNAFGEQIL